MKRHFGNRAVLECIAHSSMNYGRPTYLKSMFCVISILFATSAYAVQSAEPASHISKAYSASTQPKYPDIWWRHPQLSAPFNGDTWLGTTKECADNSSHCNEVYLLHVNTDLKNPGISQVVKGGYLYSFFSGKKAKILNIKVNTVSNFTLSNIHFYENSYADLLLADGSKLNLVLALQLIDSIEESDRNATLALAEGFAAGDALSRKEAAALSDQIGEENLTIKLQKALWAKKEIPFLRLRYLHGSVEYKQYLDCVPMLNGIEAVDQKDNVLWQRFVVARGPLISKPNVRDEIEGNALYPYGPSCFTKNQFWFRSANTASVSLADGTIILSLGNLGAVRIRLDGVPTPLPEHVRVFYFKSTMEFMRLIYQQRNQITHWTFNESESGAKIIPIFPASKPKSLEFDNPLLPANFIIMQYYLFPELLKKPAFSLNP